MPLFLNARNALRLGAVLGTCTHVTHIGDHIICLTSGGMASVAPDYSTCAHPAYIQRQNEYYQLLKPHCSRKHYSNHCTPKQVLPGGAI